jgi:hypothetical protein
MNEADLSVVIEQGLALQRRFPGKELVAVGGSQTAVGSGGLPMI